MMARKRPLRFQSGLCGSGRFTVPPRMCTGHASQRTGRGPLRTGPRCDGPEQRPQHSGTDPDTRPCGGAGSLTSTHRVR